jgi:hypothetical protein
MVCLEERRTIPSFHHIYNYLELTKHWILEDALCDRQTSSTIHPRSSRKSFLWLTIDEGTSLPLFTILKHFSGLWKMEQEAWRKRKDPLDYLHCSPERWL